MSDKLLKCPFCGGEAVIFYGALETTSAQCLQCGVETSLFSDSPSGSGKQLAIAAWNRRAEHDTETNRLEIDTVKNAALTLDELRGMDGESVWVTNAVTTKYQCYIVDVEEDELKNPWDRMSLECVGENEFFQAYRRKLEGV